MVCPLLNVVFFFQWMHHIQCLNFTVYFSPYLIHKLAEERKIVILMGVGIMSSRKQIQISIPLKYH